MAGGESLLRQAIAGLSVMAELCSSYIEEKKFKYVSIWSGYFQ